MQIYVNGVRDKHKTTSVTFLHRSWTVSVSRNEFTHFSEEIAVSPPDGYKVPVECLLAHDRHTDIRAAIAAIDKIADAVVLGLLELEDLE